MTAALDTAPADGRHVAVDAGEIYFGQQHAHTVGFFQAAHLERWTRVRVSEMPHFAFVDGDPQKYARYLGYSWQRKHGSHVPPHLIAEQCERFARLVHDIRQARTVEEPVSLYKSPDGCLCIVHGNHRAAVALSLGLPLPAQVMSAEDYARRIIEVPDEFDGSRHRSMPYQTVYNGREVLVEGRRDDLLERFEAIDSTGALRGKTLLDLGSNYGMSSYLALKLGGVREAHLVEHSPKVTTAAVRLAVLLNSPGARFHVLDLREDVRQRLPVCDVGFAFSIAAHIGKLENIVALFRSHLREALFYETHERRDIEEPVRDAFPDRTEIGRLGDRRLFLLRPS